MSKDGEQRLDPVPTPAGEPSAAGDGGAAQVQQTTDEETEKGYRGTKVDPRPDSDYTVAGAIRRKGEDLTSGGGETSEQGAEPAK